MLHRRLKGKKEGRTEGEKLCTLGSENECVVRTRR